MWFRLLLGIVTLACWSFSLWTAGHRSDNPSILGLYSKEYAAFLVASLGLSLLATAVHSRALYQRLYALRHLIVGTILSTILGLAAAEALARVFDPLGISYYRESARYHLDKIPDPDLVFIHRAGFDETYQGVLVSTNDLGMRDRPIPPKSANEYRVLVLGDSVTFGWGVRAEDTYERALESDLSTRLRRGVRTINTGVGGYNSDQELGMLERYGARLSPDLVLLLYVPNDVEPAPPKPFDPWTERSVMKASPPGALQLLLGRSWIYRLLVHVLRFGQRDTSAPPHRESPGWNSSLSSVSRIAAYCSSRRVPFALFYYRQIRSPQNDALAEDLVVLATKAHFPFRDILPWFGGTKPREITNSVVDSHPNAKGHAILAKGMGNALVEWGLLPTRNR